MKLSRISVVIHSGHSLRSIRSMDAVIVGKRSPWLEYCAIMMYCEQCWCFIMCIMYLENMVLLQFKPQTKMQSDTDKPYEATLSLCIHFHSNNCILDFDADWHVVATLPMALKSMSPKRSYIRSAWPADHGRRKPTVSAMSRSHNITHLCNILAYVVARSSVDGVMQISHCALCWLTVVNL